MGESSCGQVVLTAVLCLLIPQGGPWPVLLADGQSRPGVSPVFACALHQPSMHLGSVHSRLYLLASILENFLRLPLVILLSQPAL